MLHVKQVQFLVGGVLVSSFSVRPDSTTTLVLKPDFLTILLTFLVKASEINGILIMWSNSSFCFLGNGGLLNSFRILEMLVLMTSKGYPEFKRCFLRVSRCLYESSLM